MKNAHHIFYRRYPDDFPKLREVFKCPHCDGFCQQKTVYESEKMWDKIIESNGVYICFKCLNCSQLHLYHLIIWDLDIGGEAYYNAIQLYPMDTVPNGVDLPNEHLPADIKSDYLEAALIVEKSPRGAAALLRLCIQKLCHNHFDKKITINEAVKRLNNVTPNKDLIKALDIVRVIGNEAVHPGQLDLQDDQDTAKFMFSLVNYIAGNMMQSNEIKEKYVSLVPPNIQKFIADRDGTS